jgi:hypothetical protein
MCSLAALVFVVFAAGCVAGEEDDGAWNDGPLEVTADDQAIDDEMTALAMDSKADSALSYLKVAELAYAGGIPCVGDRIATAVAVAKAESSFRPWITNTVGNTYGIDRGLWQINSHWHPEVSASCALSASCNARAAARISSGGRYWTQWWTYKNRKHVPYMAAARSAQAAICD